MKHLYLFSFIISSFTLFSQNVGINQSAPTNSLHISPIAIGNDPLRIDNMQSYVSGDTTLMIIDNTTGIVRYVAKSDLGGMLGDVLFQNSTFLDSLNNFVTNNGGGSGSDTDVDSARVVGNTLQIFENGTMITADLTNVTGTSYIGGTGIGISGNTITNTSPDQVVGITGGGSTTVTGTYPNFTVSSSSSSYTAGSGIGISGNTITNSAPDQTVSITGTGNTTVTGTYPNFTISSTDNQTLGSNATQITLTNGGNVSFSTINANDWHTNGNAGTNPASNFLGTTNNVDLVFRTNNTERMRIAANGAIMAGTTTPSARLTSVNTLGSGIYGQGGAALSSGVTGLNTDLVGTGIVGVGNNLTPIVFSTGTGGSFIGNDGSYSAAQIASGTGVIGLGNNIAMSNSTSGGSGGAFTGIDGVYGKGVTVANGTGVIGAGNNVGTYFTFNNGGGGSFTGTQNGVFGIATNTSGTSIGVLGQGSEYGLFANGNFGASGLKTFVIDHPLDPENKILKHFCMESPEVLNFYRGNVILDDNGDGIVKLPNYFSSININYSYTLTPIGSPSSTYIAEEVNENGEFIIAGGNPNQKISWAIYAERNDINVTQDPLSKAVEIDKPIEKRGTYINPKAYGKSNEYYYYGGKENKDKAIKAQALKK